MNKVVSGLLLLTLAASFSFISATSVAAAGEPTDTPAGNYTDAQLAANNYTLYYADAADATPATVDAGDVMGLNQGNTDQAYGADPITGMHWGYGSSTSTHNDVDKYSSVRYYSGSTHNSNTAVNYSFELPVPGYYYVTVGVANPWSARNINIFLERTNVSGNLNIPLTTRVERTYKVNVTDGILNVDVQTAPGQTANSSYDPMVGMITVQKAIPASYLESKIASLAAEAAKTNEDGTTYYTAFSIAEATTAIAAAQALDNSISSGTADINSDAVQIGTGGIRDQLKGLTTATADLVQNVPNTTFKPGQLMRDTNGAVIDAHGAGFLYDKITKKYYWYGENHVGTWPASGVRLYSSTDLLNWTDEGKPLTMITSMDQFTNDPVISALYAGRTDTANIFDDIRVGRIIERPKVIYNDSTKKYVMWMHIEGSTNADGTLNQSYAKAEAGVAISDSPTGPFVYQAGYRMDQAPPDQIDYHPDNKGYARDMNLFKDDDGTAYLIYSSEENLTMYISKLTPDYTDITGWHKDGNVDANGRAIRDTSYKAVYGVDYTRVFPGAQREAPAMFKYDGKYYLLDSGATGWSANENKYTVADHIMGPWSPMVDPFVRTLPTDPNPLTAFNTQSTYVIPVDPANGKFIYVGDIWNGGNFANNGAKYVFLPIEFGLGTDIAIKWYDSWAPSLLDYMGKVNITTKFPEAVALGTLPSLPATVDVLEKGATVSTPVTWTVNAHTPTAADFSTPGLVTLQVTLPAYNNKVENINMYVIPSKTMFFVNAGGYATTDYGILTSYMQNTLVNKNVIDQAYQASDPSPWGYVGADTLPSGSAGGDIFSTVRYLNGGNSSSYPKGTDLSYKFAVNNGSYDVYLGFSDPWSNTSRKANLLLNGVVKGAITFTPKNTQTYKDVAVTNNSLDITVRNTASQDPMISWIMIVNNTLPPADDSSMGFVGTAVSSTSVNLTWNKTLGATGYTLYRSDSADGTYAVIYNTVAGTYTDTGLQPNKTYYYKVSSTNGSGVESALSNVQSITTLSQSAQEIADGITAIAAPAKDATSLTLPELEDGYSVAIKSSDNLDVLGTDGSITPPSADTTVNLILEVTRTSDNSKADTQALPVVVPAKTPLPAATLTVTGAVYPGQSFDLTYGLSNLGQIAVGGIYAQEVTVNYDATHLQLSAATSLIDGLFVSQAGAPGHIRIISASQGAAHAITGDNSGAILKLSFQVEPAAQSVTSTVYLSGVAVADSHGVETQLQGASSSVVITVADKAALNTLIASAQAKYDAAVEGGRPGQYPTGSKASLQAAITKAQNVADNSAASPAQVDQATFDLNASLQSFLASIIVASPGDLSGDGKFSVGDLAIVASHYGENTSSPNWLASADINHDGVIDIIDLAAVAHDMISQE